MVRTSEHFGWRRPGAGVCLALVVSACGSPVASGVAVGKVGQSLSSHANTAPAGARVCALREAAAAPPGITDKIAWSEACAKTLQRDELYRRAMVVLAAHGETLESIALGDSKNAGRIEAARTGVKGSMWIEVDEASDKAAREAVAKLVEQMGATSSKDLAQAVKDAGPHVKTVCDNLDKYLEEQARSLGAIQSQIEKKRASKMERRCAMLDNKSLCFSETAIDRAVYASTLGELAALESHHIEARDDAAAFCAAHKTLEQAAADGKLGDDATYASIVDAVKNARRGKPPADSSASSDGADTGTKKGADKGHAPAPPPGPAPPALTPN